MTNVTDDTANPLMVDPQMVPVLEAMAANAAVRPHPSTLPPDAMRRQFAADMAYWAAGGPELARVENRMIPGPRGDIPLRLYDPAGDAALRPVLVYFHGGGWTIGDLDTEDRKLRELALASGAIIVSVDYRLAPDHKFPEPLEDCIAAVRWIAAEGAAIGIDGGRLALGGLSAGANLALAAAISLRDAGGPALRHLLLFQGSYGAHDTESHALFGGGEYGLDRRSMANYYRHYLRRPEDRDHPLVAPLMADLSGLPPVFLNAAGLDVLRDDSAQLAERLRAAGVAVDHRLYPGVIHVFTLMSRRLDMARRAIAEAAEALRAAL